ncbi:hypothetical protein [Curtobacterium sp. MCJR17_043]|uniref:hypothetical protein n=1 Tax=Curtobacterium sp. MCJR17_043 TaxID=2175660 RepID=UPI0024DF97F8|nr:hypothetical protein [Curtobacterium sp. MCJR17_043]WIB37203.1 hypothetical protein DEJ15_13590 [Curtobacterium sp. MCJR17_043]
MHANGLDDVAARLEALGALAGLGPESLARQAASAFDLVLHVERRHGVRRLAAVGRMHVDRAGRLVVADVEAVLSRAASSRGAPSRVVSSSGDRVAAPEGARTGGPARIDGCGSSAPRSGSRPAGDARRDARRVDDEQCRRRTGGAHRRPRDGS